MKKKIFRIAAGTVLGIAFLGAVIFAYRQYNSEEEETSKDSAQYRQKVPEALTPYQIGDEIEVGDFLWQVSEAEIIENYEELDNYYKSRGYLKKPEPNQQNPFVEEQKYLRVEFSVKNINEEKDAVFNPCTIEFANYRGGGIFEYWGGDYGGYYYNGQYYSVYDGVYYSDYLPREVHTDGKYTKTNASALETDFQDRKDLTLSPNETVYAEFIVEFSEYGKINSSGGKTRYYIYDLCMELEGSGHGIYRSQYVSLEIAPKHLDITRTEPDNTYDEQRDIAEMKIRQMTNLEMKQYQKEPYPLQPKYEGDSEEESIVEENYIADYGCITQIQKSEIVEWKDLPEIYTQTGYLWKMAERYKNDYGYSEEELKVLLLDIYFEREKDYSEVCFCFYDNSWLFTRDSEGKRWEFGTADDWTVLSNTKNPQRTGHINTEWIGGGNSAVNTEWIGGGDSVVVQMAYILPPDIWQQEEALYFCGGYQFQYPCSQTAEIKLD